MESIDGSGGGVASGSELAARDPKTGQFLPGNQASTGNPNIAKVAKLKAAIVEASTVEDIRSIMRSLLRMAQSDNVYAAREYLDRVVGKSVDNSPQQQGSLVQILLAQNERDRVLLESPEARQLAAQWQAMVAKKTEGTA